MQTTYFEADYIYHNNDFSQCVPIKVGLKIRVDQQMLDKLQSDDYIQSKFKLNVKRLNRWWYSVYFDELKGE